MAIAPTPGRAQRYVQRRKTLNLTAKNTQMLFKISSK
jgi:hypothetical protein